MTLSLEIELPLVVFSDLDGTLLDHSTYSWELATEALNALRRAKGALILASSKTAAEIIPLKSALGFAHMPAIIENGAGLIEPGSDDASSPGDYEEIRQALSEMPPDLRKLFTGFGDMSSHDIAQKTGLDLESATLAATHQFSEPGLWAGDERQKDHFVALLSERGVKAKQGGRFLTFSMGATKADQIDKVMSYFDSPARKIALGDAPNDIEMLAAVDTGYLVGNAHGASVPEMLGEKDGTVKRMTLNGPAAWNVAVLNEIEDLGGNHG